MARPGLFVQVVRRSSESRQTSKHIPGEWVAHHKISMDAQFFAELTNLVLKHLSQRLNQFQLQCRQRTMPIGHTIFGLARAIS